MMAISYDRRIVMCEQSKSITSLKFVKMMDNCLPKTFDLNINPNDRRPVQDGDAG